MVYLRSAFLEKQLCNIFSPDLAWGEIGKRECAVSSGRLRRADVQPLPAGIPPSASEHVTSYSASFPVGIPHSWYDCALVMCVGHEMLTE